MARTNLNAVRVKPETSELITLRVLRTERISPHFARVTLGDGDIDRFSPMGFDQWFRLFIPVNGGTLSRVPRKLTTTSYLRYLTVSKTKRPLLRNYTVRAYRPDGMDGPELDVDFVLHGSADDQTAGPAAIWATTCTKGDIVGILDEGIGFNPAPSIDRVLLVADESGLPAVAGILSALPPDTKGRVLVELPSEDDRQDLTTPDGVDVEWIVRENGVPGRTVLKAAESLDLPTEPFFAWTVGEQTLPTRLRRHWVKAGVPKNNIMFCGYWRNTHNH
ncbi:siderophore-interacting protein [Actinomadura madurae]|uniref:siderophore-interacting protein n=1 Tax=Actinomadura madurae TaxID=1993 RepID=UPI0020D2208A|nr:siderophore-interacting protein [Actinomadura madurae]MCP9948198.1 siderophore-interacting protein [Actinomadura madurae]MCP9964969.1 siderophore-interacting protein [Actinomadura madurae]MCP9977460.1 siderophore-interacting protein [Actinomadura madurae]MCQ0011036.1 siderophore-interacting protein [Actinomadura madurae]MCQ0013643.1 siderophore-interacting protein [Actinomadura madurae]